MFQATDLVFQGENRLVGANIDDFCETPFVRIYISTDAATFHEPSIWTGKVRNVDLHMVAVIRREDFGRFAEKQKLISSNTDGCSE